MNKRLLLVTLATLLSVQSAFAASVDDIEEQINAAQEKTTRSVLKKEIENARLKMEVLEDLADPSLASFYRSYSGGVTISLASLALLGEFAYIGTRLNQTAPPTVREMTTGFVIISIWGMSGYKLKKQIDYNKIKDAYRKLSPEEQASIYRKLSDTVKADMAALDQEQ